MNKQTWTVDSKTVYPQDGSAPYRVYLVPGREPMRWEEFLAFLDTEREDGREQSDYGAGVAAGT